VTVGLRETMGKPAIDRGSAERLGELRHTVVDASSRAVVDLVVGHGRKVAFVDWAQASLGPDALIVQSSRSPTDDESRDVDGARDPLDKRVLSDQGIEIGVVVDVTIDDDGRVREITTTEGSITGDRLLGVGSYAVVVAHDAS
jgi:sporulation protein YlmC with PRC-barrel domain